MKAISLWQPWATLMAIGAKNWETRSWDTQHRGPLLIHAAKRWTRVQRDFANHPLVRKALEAAGYHSSDLLPRGGIVCCVELLETLPADDTGLPRLEQIVGDFGPDRFMWRCKLIRRYEPMIPLIGRQGLFDVELAELGDTREVGEA